MNEQLLLRLPHRQVGFTLPKVLRVFFRHDQRLHGQISRLVYGLVRDFTTAASDSSTRTTAVVVFQSSGQFARWNPHWYGLFLKGGFDREGRFVHVPTVDLAKNMVEWTHSGFSVDYANWNPSSPRRTIQA
jgi:hypothetical protein